MQVGGSPPSSSLIFQIDSHGEREMWSFFQRWERVWEVFIPRRMSKAGFRFGFVKFLDVRDPKTLERNLDCSFIGGKKLFVNLPRFNKPIENQETEKRTGGSRVEEANGAQSWLFQRQGSGIGCK